jgi:sugar lactone lactonase YvrE
MRFIAFVVLAWPVLAQDREPCRLVTVIGSPTADAGDGGLATDAELSGVTATGYDTEGNLYIATEHKIRIVSPDGVIRTFAGSGAHGYEGDGGPALQASFRSISSIKLDLEGNVYVADILSQVVRKIDRAGTIVTVAGNGATKFVRPSSLALDAGGNLFIADSWDNLVYQLSPDGELSVFAGTGKPSYLDPGSSEQATQFSITPVQIAADSRGGLILLDARSIVYRVDVNKRISRIAGGGTSSLQDGVMAAEASFAISGFDVSPLGEAYVVQSPLLPLAASSTIWMKVDENGQLRSVPGSIRSSGKLVGFTPAGEPIGLSIYGVLSRLSQGQLFPIAGASSDGFAGDGGPGTAAKLGSPRDLATDSEGSLFITDIGNRRIRKLSADGSISTYYSAESDTEYPVHVTSDRQGNVYFATSQSRIFKIDRSGAVSLVLGGGGFADRFSATLAIETFVFFVNSLKADPAGNLFFTSVDFPGYWMIEAHSGLLRPRNRGIRPYSIVGRDNEGGILTIAGSRLYRLTAETPPTTVPTRAGWSFFPGAYATDPVSKSIFYIENRLNLRRLDTDGRLYLVVSGLDPDNIFSSASPAVLPTKMEFDERGDLFIADDQNNRVRKLTNPAACPATPVSDILPDPIVTQP